MFNSLSNTEIKNYAKQLRKEMTRQERHLWYDFLQKHRCKWYKQKPNRIKKAVEIYLMVKLHCFFCLRLGFIPALNKDITVYSLAFRPRFHCFQQLIQFHCVSVHRLVCPDL